MDKIHEQQVRQERKEEEGGEGEHLGMLSQVEFMCRAMPGPWVHKLVLVFFFNFLGVVLCRLVPKELILL